MKLRLVPVIISIAVTTVLLFGGYFTYKSAAMQNPLESIVTNIDGVELSEIKLSNTEAAIEVTLSQETSLREVYQTIKEEGASVLGDRKLNLKAVSKSSPELDKWWSSVLFDIAQAMETKQYSAIPDALNAGSNETGIKAVTEMDNTNVYITLRSNEAVKHIILPRQPAMLEVW